MYKRKNRKVNPVKTPLPGGINPGGNANFGDMDGPLGKRSGKIVPRGSRLTPERRAQIRIGNGFLSEEEKQVFIDILFE